MLTPVAVQTPRHPLVPCFTVAQAAAITGVPRKLIDQYLDRELEFLTAVGAGFRAVRKEGLLPLRLNYEYSDSLKDTSRLEVIREALANPRKKFVNVSGDQLTVRVDVARSLVSAGLNRLRSANALVVKNDEILSGEPCIKGTRLSVYIIHGLFEAHGRDEVLETYPTLSNRELDAALMFAEMYPRKGRPRSVESRLGNAKPTRSRVIKVSASSK